MPGARGGSTLEQPLVLAASVAAAMCCTYYYCQHERRSEERRRERDAAAEDMDEGGAASHESLAVPRTEVARLVGYSEAVSPETVASQAVLHQRVVSSWGNDAAESREELGRAVADVLALIQAEQNTKQTTVDSVRERLAQVEKKLDESVEYVSQLEASLQEALKKQSNDMNASLRLLRRDVSGLKQNVKRLWELQREKEDEDDSKGPMTTASSSSSSTDSSMHGASSPAARGSSSTPISSPMMQATPTPKKVYVSEWADLFED